MKNVKQIEKPLIAIRAKCLDCCCYQESEIRNCPSVDCPLYAFRLGKNPFRKMNLSDEERKIRSERMRKLRQTEKKDENN